MKSSEAYSGAVARAKSSPAVMAALGTPVKEGFAFTGKIYEGNGSGNADLVIPISGPKGKANIYVTATRAQGQWHFDELVVQVEKTHERINLSETNGLSAEMPDSSPKKP